MTGLVERLLAFDRHPGSATFQAADRITALEAQLVTASEDISRLDLALMQSEAAMQLAQIRQAELLRTVAALEAQVAAADRLADAIDSDHGYCGDADPLCPICIERAAFRAAKGE